MLSDNTLFTATDLAGFCQVDLKTIHNWVDKGKVPHFRTPGRHLRFKAADVEDFMRHYGYPVPPELASEPPAEAKGIAGPKARIVDVFDDGSVTLVVERCDVVALRALEGREILLALPPEKGA